MTYGGDLLSVLALAVYHAKTIALEAVMFPGKGMDISNRLGLGWAALPAAQNFLPQLCETQNEIVNPEC